MAFETCDIPSNIDSGLDITLPAELAQDISDEAYDGLIDCFVESLNISSPSESFTDSLKFYLKQIFEQEWRYLTNISQEDIFEYIDNALEILIIVNPSEYIKLHNNNGDANVIFNWLHIDFYSSIDTSKFSVDEMKALFLEWIIWGEEVISILEWEEWFQEDKNIIIDKNWAERGYTLWDALEDFWFSDQLLWDAELILWRELNKSETQNLTQMIRYFMYIESSGWYNVSNYEWISSAKWYFQYLTKNGKYLREVRDSDWNWSKWWDWSLEHVASDDVRRVWWTNSYETALKNLPPEIRERQVFQWEIDKIWDTELQSIQERLDLQDLQDPRKLSSSEQTTLFLSDLSNRAWSSALLQKMLAWDITVVDDLYRLHHTNTDSDTESLMLLAWEYIYDTEIQIYSVEWNWITGRIMPWDSITQFFTDLIREFYPATSLTSSAIMSSLSEIPNVKFPWGWKVNISRSTEEWYAYVLELNGDSYMKVDNDWNFSLAE